MADPILKYSAQDSQIIKNVNRDVRSIPKKIDDFLKTRNSGYINITLGVVSLLFPPIAVFCLATIGLIRYRNSLRKFRLPLYLPQSIGKIKDPALLKPGTNAETMTAAGIFYYGVNAETNEQIYMYDNGQRQHLNFFSTTGGGKTESLIGFLVNTFNHGSGFCFIDGKADLNLPAKLLSIAHRYMRIDDFYLMNFIQGNRNIWGNTSSQMSNSFNPFATGSVGSISELLKSLLDGDGDIWAKRAESLVSAIVRVLVYLRDQNEIALSVKHFADYMPLEQMGALVGRDDIPLEIKNELYNFVANLPGMDQKSLQSVLKGQSPKGNTTIYDQLGFVTMQIIPVMNMLKGDYGYIFDVMHGDILMKDVVANRRIMICLLPALEKSSSTIAQLGRITITAIKDMAGGGIGSQFEGDLQKNLSQRFTTSKSAYPIVCDEAGYYFVKGAFAPLFAQARGIGLSMILSAQDIPALKKLGEEVSREVDSVIGNANTKWYGRIEDMGDTYEGAKKRLGTINVAQNTQRELNTGLVTDGYTENSISIQEKDRIHQNDFARLREGQVFLVHMDTIIRVNLFSVFPPEVLELRNVHINAPTTIPSPNERDIEKHKHDINFMAIKLRKMIRKTIVIDDNIPSDEFNKINDDFSGTANSMIRLGENVLSAFQHRLSANYDDVFNNTYPNFDEPFDEPNDPDQDEKEIIAEEKLGTAIDDNKGSIDEGSVNIAKSKAEQKYDELSAEFGDAFDGLLDRASLSGDLNKINNAILDDPALSSETTEKAINTIKTATLYPGKPKLKASKETMMDLLNDTLDEMN